MKIFRTHSDHKAKSKVFSIVISYKLKMQGSSQAMLLRAPSDS